MESLEGSLEFVDLIKCLLKPISYLEKRWDPGIVRPTTTRFQATTLDTWSLVFIDGAVFDLQKVVFHRYYSATIHSNV